MSVLTQVKEGQGKFKFQVIDSLICRLMITKLSFLNDVEEVKCAVWMRKDCII